MLTILKRPEKFTPSGNNIIWQIESDNDNIIYFKVELFDNETSSLIFLSNFGIKPEIPKGTVIDLSRILSNVVNWEVNNDSLKLITPIYKTIRGYRLKITERIVNTTSGLEEDGSVYNNLSDVNYVFNAKLGRIAANNFIQVKYVINSASVSSFLTNKPNHSKANNISAENLYFMQDGTVAGLRARIRTFDGSGSVIETETQLIPSIGQYKMYRINCSPKALMDSCNLHFNNVAYYVVDIIDGLANPRTEERVYLYEQTKCHLDYVNLMWVNALGGIDSYQFVAPQDSINVSRFTMKRNTSGINDDGIYSDLNNGVYHPSDVIIDNDVTTVTKVTSQEINDKEAYWFAELFYSKQLFVELPDTTLVPALLNNTSYSIPRLKYNRGNINTISIDFTMAQGIIPAGVQAYSTRTSSIEFIDSQMNSLVNNLPGYDITSNTDTNNYSDDDYTQSYN